MIEQSKTGEKPAQKLPAICRISHKNVSNYSSAHVCEETNQGQGERPKRSRENNSRAHVKPGIVHVPIIKSIKLHKMSSVDQSTQNSIASEKIKLTLKAVIVPTDRV